MKKHKIIEVGSHVLWSHVIVNSSDRETLKYLATKFETIFPKEEIRLDESRSTQKSSFFGSKYSVEESFEKDEYYGFVVKVTDKKIKYVMWKLINLLCDLGWEPFSTNIYRGYIDNNIEEYYSSVFLRYVEESD